MRRVVAVAIVANLIGGMSYVPAKVALTGLSETTLVVVRTVVALAVLLPLGGRGVRPLLAAPRGERRVARRGAAGARADRGARGPDLRLGRGAAAGGARGRDAPRPARVGGHDRPLEHGAHRARRVTHGRLHLPAAAVGRAVRGR